MADTRAMLEKMGKNSLRKGPSGSDELEKPACVPSPKVMDELQLQSTLQHILSPTAQKGHTPAG